MHIAVAPVRIGPGPREHLPLALGGSTFGPAQYSGQEDANLLGAMDASLAHGVTHFDTAEGYGDGHSERLIGRFIAQKPERREQLFIASKSNLDDISAAAMLRAVDASRARLQCDVIDLYYIHWPRTGKDMRPWMEGLETARQKGKIRAVGVSNFSVEQMAALEDVGRIDAHQLGYSLLWRGKERDVIPYCAAHRIAVVSYSSLAHGILAGRLPANPAFPVGDHRRTILLFRADLWPTVHAAAEALKAAAARAGRPLAYLAIRWLLRQPGVTSVIVGARNAQQAAANAAALDGQVTDDVFAEMTRISDEVMRALPDEDNPYDYHP
ncbi:MAG: aldo/keto reductase [Anaerolineae bacterium]|nr:aldo/keto reductase [Anaerolineae bacterium]